MKKSLFVLFFVMTLFVYNPARAVFVEGLEDMPLPDGVAQIENGSLSFGNEEIRLFETYFSSEKKSFKEIKKFYEDTLPQMGWVRKKRTEQTILFERDGETLEISEESKKPLILRLIVKSKAQ